MAYVWLFAWNHRKILRKTEKKSGLLSSILGGIFFTIQAKEVRRMVEIQIPDNPTEIRIYTQGLPDLRRIPEEVKEAIVRILVRGTVEYLQDKQNKAVS